jgi:hypothetical protein
VQLEQRGVVTATIVTSGFVKAAEAHRKLLKQPELPYFVVPHPIVSLSDEDLRASADAIYDGIVKTLFRTGS